MPGIEKVKAHSFDEDLPEQVKACIEQGLVWLYLCFDQERYLGFVVLRPEITATARRGLHIWAAYSDGSPLDACMEEVCEMARSMDCMQVTFSSPRKGWARRMRDFQPTYQVYRKVL